MGWEIAAIVAAIAGAYSSYRGVQAQNKAQEKASKIQNRQAAIENQRQARRAIAKQRMMRAEMVQNTETMGVRGSSALEGATGSLISQTASNIGAANTQLAGDWGVNNALKQGASAQANWDTTASVFNLASQFAGFGANRAAEKAALQQQQDMFSQQMDAWKQMMQPPPPNAGY